MHRIEISETRVHYVLFLKWNVTVVNVVNI